MKPSIYITEKSIKELERQANKLIKAVNEEGTKLLLSQARLVRDRIRAKAKARRLTGRREQAVYAIALPPSLNGPAVAFAGIRARKAPAAHLAEFGHAGPHPAPPHPVVQPAWDECKDEVRRNIEQGLKKTVEGAV